MSLKETTANDVAEVLHEQNTEELNNEIKEQEMNKREMTQTQFLNVAREMVRVLQSPTNRAIVNNVIGEVQNGNASLGQAIAEIIDELDGGSDADLNDPNLEQALDLLRDAVAEYSRSTKKRQMTGTQFLNMARRIIEILDSPTNKSIVENVIAEYQDEEINVAQGIAEILDELQGSDADTDDQNLEDALDALRETVGRYSEERKKRQLTTAQFISVAREMIDVLESPTNRAIVNNVIAEVENGSATIAAAIAEIRQELISSDADREDEGIEEALDILNEAVEQSFRKKPTRLKNKRNLGLKEGYISRDEKRNLNILTFKNPILKTRFNKNAHDGEKLELSAYPIVWGETAEIIDDDGYYEETFYRGCLEGINLNNVMVFKDHDSNKVLGNPRNGKTKFREDSVGLRMDMTLPNTTLGRDTYNEVMDDLKGGVSIGFRTNAKVRNGKRIVNRDNPITALVEVSIVTTPAFETSVVVARGKQTSEFSKLLEEI